MPEVHPTPSHAGKVGGFLQQSTAGLPNWAWILVIGAGIAAAIIIPKFIKGGGSSPTDTSGAQGLGLAVDPTTGLPYAVEGLVPSGSPIQPPSIPQSTNTTAIPTPTPTTTLVSTRGLWTGEQDAGDKLLPIWGSPNASSEGGISGVPLNTQLQVGAPVTGNYYGTQKQYYPVSYNGKQGYILASDLSLQGQGSTGPSWPTPYQRSRHRRVVS